MSQLSIKGSLKSRHSQFPVQKMTQVASQFAAALAAAQLAAEPYGFLSGSS